MELFRIFDPGNAATAEIERYYEEEIERFSQSQLESHPFGFGSFDNGTPVSAAARKLYRDHADLRRAFPDPYATDHGRMSYLDWLRQHRPGMVDGLRPHPGILRRAFDDLFDETYYLATYPDVASEIAAGRYASAREHYCTVGSRLFFDPNEFFVSSFYFDQAADHDRYATLNSGHGMESTLLWHYLTVGLANGFEPIEFFNSRWYLDQYPDVAAAMRIHQVSTPLAHFLLYGSGEGRDPGPSFSGDRYLDDAPDARTLAEADDSRGPFGIMVRSGGVIGRVHV